MYVYLFYRMYHLKTLLSKLTLNAPGRINLKSKYILARSIYNYRSEDNIIRSHRNVDLPINEDLYSFLTKQMERNSDKDAVVIIVFLSYFAKLESELFN